MAGETSLQLLLQNLSPSRETGDYVFCTMEAADPLILAESIGTFRELEGMTYILPKKQADQLGLHYDTVMAWITLQVHSSLEAVGLTAAVASVLADAGISCNVVAAYYHDHLFVPIRDAGRALELLQELAA